MCHGRWLTCRRGICETAASMLREVRELALSCSRFRSLTSLSPAAAKLARYPAQRPRQDTLNRD